MINVSNEVITYNEPAKPNIRVHSDWCRSDRIKLQIGDYTVTVIASDLRKAIDNAINT